MTQIYTRQAQSFLIPNSGLYRRPPPHLVMPYMVRMSGAIRSTDMANRTAAVKMVQANMMTAWAVIHRAMRPYFFKDIQPVIEGWPQAGIHLPDMADNEHVHQAMHFCLDVIVDLDRLTMLLQAEAGDEESATIFECWNAVNRATSRVRGLEGRIKSGKGFS